MPSKHTPSPWRLRTDPSHYDSLTDICDDGGHLIAQTCGDWSPMEANARLIAAAPDLLEALRAVEPLMIPGMNWTDETGELVKSMVRAAITKAIPLSNDKA